MSRASQPSKGHGASSHYHLDAISSPSLSAGNPVASLPAVYVRTGYLNDCADLVIDVPVVLVDNMEDSSNLNHNSNVAVKRLARRADEPLKKALERLAKSAMPKNSKAKKKYKKDDDNDTTHSKQQQQQQQEEESAVVNLRLLDANGDTIDDTLPNAEAWTRAASLVWTNNAPRLPVRCNAPSVDDSVYVPTTAIVGCPLLAVPQGTAFVADVDDTSVLQWQWHRRRDEAETWAPLPHAQAREYTPDVEEDTNKQLMVTCTPLWTDGSAILNRRVASPAVTCVPAPQGRLEAIEARAEAFRQQRSRDNENGSFRIVSYNLLAAAYEHTWDDMYPYLSKEHRGIDYRQHLLLDDLRRLDGDIVALQEVDAAVFDRAYAPHMHRRGYTGVHAAKASDSAEGCALFVRKSHFRVCATERVELRALAAEARESDEAFASYVKAFPDAYGALQKATTIGLVALLEETRVANDGTSTPRQVLVINTHLFFHPRAGHARIMQIYLLLNAASSWFSNLACTMGRRRVTWADVGIVLCGDLNEEPFDGGLHLLRDGVVSAAHPEWVSSELFRYGRFGAREVVERFCGAGGDFEATLRERIELLRIVGQAAATLRSRREDGAIKPALPPGASAQSRVLTLVDSSPNTISHKTHEHVAALVLRRVLLGTSIEDDISPTFSEQEWHDVEAAVRAMRDAVREEKAAMAAKQAEAVEAAGLLPLSEDGASTACGDRSAAAFSDGGDRIARIEGAVGVGLQVAQTARLTCATGYPDYTNYVGGFQGCLDYIFVGDRTLRSLRCLDAPSHAAVTANRALPSACFASDHLPVAADVGWTEH
ncbi:2',5'-phosphodiesterase [Pseudoscourfieldia marina]